jgi:ABC-2 type transport system permease protein
VVSFSGNTIKEREDGRFDRLMTMPCSFTKYLSSKMLLYVFVCILQFLMVLAMGVCLFPLLGLDVFEINGHFFRMFLVVFCAACAAIGFGRLSAPLQVLNSKRLFSVPFRWLLWLAIARYLDSYF